jgi:tRNA nucleotidyltransferase (CCA-adding enzyme)
MSIARNAKTLNLLPALRRRLSPATAALLDAIVSQAEGQGGLIYLVGGFVRDLLLRRPNLDLDLVLEGDAIQLGRALAKKFGGRLVAHKPFGTAVWWLPENQTALLRQLRVPKKKNTRLPAFFDLITARRESYRYPAALPSVQFAGIREDQYRRDFTINTMAIRLDGNDAGILLDPWGGAQDLRAGLLRTLHSDSFSDDPTRVLRILRLAARLNFKIESGTRAQLQMHLPVLKQVSGERIRTEVELALQEKERPSILQSMQKFGVLRTIHPNLRFSAASARTLAAGEKPIPAYWNLDSVSKVDLGFVLWMLESSVKDLNAIVVRLAFRADLRAAVIGAANLHRAKAKLARLPVSKLVELLENLPDLSVYAVYLAVGNSVLAKRLKLYATKWRKIQPRTDGNKLRSLGLEPGPSYKRILGALRAAWLDGDVRNLKQEKALLERLRNE